jgi:hypothetical protein
VAESVDVLKLALPAPSNVIELARVVAGAAQVPPSMKVTPPVGTALLFVTVAVNETESP